MNENAEQKTGQTSLGDVFFKSVIAVFFGIALSSYLFGYMMDAILDVLRTNNISLTGMKATDPDVLKSGFSIIMGLVLSLPYISTYILSYKSPGVYVSMKRPLFFFASAAVVVYLAGTAILFAVMMPYIIGFIKQLMPNDMFIFLEFNDVFYKLFLLTIMTGCFTVLPVIRYILRQAGILGVGNSSRILPKVIIMAFVIGALLTLPDPLSMIVIAVFLL